MADAGKAQTRNGKALVVDGKAKTACCCVCYCGGPATTDGGKSPFSWGDVCTWMNEATYDAGIDMGGGTCRHVMQTVNNGEANPQGVFVEVTLNGDGTWDVVATAATNDIIYAAYGLPAETFTCVQDAEGVRRWTGSASLPPADYCPGEPNATFAI